MYLKQKDIFWAMSKEFVKEVMDISVTESHKEGETLFHGGDPANAFYILLKHRLLTVPARGCLRRNPSPDNDLPIRLERIAAKPEVKNV